MPLTKQNQHVVALDRSRYSQEVVDFCTKHGLLDKLDVAVKLLNDAFPEAESVTVEVEQDPDSQQSWVMVNALVKGKASEVLLRHSECVRRLLKLLKWPASTLVRTTYTLVLLEAEALTDTMVQVVRETEQEPRSFAEQGQAPHLKRHPRTNSEPTAVTPRARTHQTEPWAPRPAGPCCFADAIHLARCYLARANEPGLRGIPDYVHLVESDDVPEDAEACYLWLGEMPEDAEITWESCLHKRTRKLPVRIRPRVLESDEAIVAVIAHELYEVVRLHDAFDASDGVLTAREIYEHISYDYPGNFHYQAVAFGDRLVQTMRNQ